MNLTEDEQESLKVIIELALVDIRAREKIDNHRIYWSKIGNVARDLLMLLDRPAK